MIVIGDIHGMYDMLEKLLSILPQTDNICFVGDVIDRGPDSKKVVDLIMNKGWKTVKGNHEEFLIHTLIEDETGQRIEPAVMHMWAENGGNDTLKSFGYTIWEYVKWFKSLPLFIEYGPFLISHSYAFNGIKTDEESVLWDRGIGHDIPGDIRNIFGHTPNFAPQSYYNKHYNIDTGAYIYGTLTAIDLTDMKLYSVTK